MLKSSSKSSQWLPYPPAYNLSIGKLFFRGMQKPGIPSKRHTDGSSLHQRNAERIDGETHALYPPISSWKVRHWACCNRITRTKMFSDPDTLVIEGFARKEIPESIDTQS